MRLPALETDRWELESGEDRHAENADSFWIPPRVEREQLRPGQAVKLLFRIESTQPDGSTEVGVERMWVLVTERIDRMYVGRLDNEPSSVEADDDVYLVRGAEVPFGPEHVIDVAEPPVEYVEEMRAASPTRVWRRS